MTDFSSHSIEVQAYRIIKIFGCFLFNYSNSYLFKHFMFLLRCKIILKLASRLFCLVHIYCMHTFSYYVYSDTVKLSYKNVESLPTVGKYIALSVVHNRNTVSTYHLTTDVSFAFLYMSYESIPPGRKRKSYLHCIL